MCHLFFLRTFAITMVNELTYTLLPLAKLEVNKGQIEGVPKNPRFIRDNKYKQLVDSISNTPEMMKARPLIVHQQGEKYVVLAGNMRLRAMRELKWHECPCAITAEGTDPKKLREYAIKDNVSFGEDDMDLLANEWDLGELTEWGMDIAFKEATETEKLSSMNYDTIYYEASRTDKDLLECVDQDKFKAKVDFIDSLDLSPERKEVMKMFAYRFLKIDFEAVADYYSFRATETEKEAIERLRLVIVDNGQVGGFIEDDLLRINSIVYEEEQDD